MTKQEIISQLCGIIDYSRDMSDASDIGDIWGRDIQALEAAIAIIERADI